MVDTELRNLLRVDMGRLIAGQLDFSEFDDAFFFRYASTEDQAVREIGAFCQSLYTETESEVGTDCRVLDAQLTGKLDRSLHFLRSDLEYEWPGQSSNPGWRFILGVAMFLTIPVLMAIPMIWLPVSLATASGVTNVLSLVGITGMFASIYLVCRRPVGGGVSIPRSSIANRAHVWPFLRSSDLSRAACQCYLVAPSVYMRR